MTRTILAVDVGYGNTKAVWGAVDDGSCEVIYKSIAPRAGNSTDDDYTDSKGSFDRAVINVNGSNYFVGREAYLVGASVPLLAKNYIQNDVYMALLRGAMHFMIKRTGVVRKKIDGLVVGLPVSQFNSKRKDLQELVRGIHPIPTPKSMVNIYGPNLDVFVDKVLVLPQPIGALRNLIGKMDADDKSVSLIVDPGYNTFDWVTSDGARPDMQRSGSFDGGVAHILRTVGNQAAKDLDLGFVDFVQCEVGLETGGLWHDGATIPFDKYKSVADEAAYEIVSKFRSRLDMSRPFNRIVMAGGGAKYYVNAMRKAFPDYEITVDKDSVMANARGFYQVGAGLLL